MHAPTLSLFALAAPLAAAVGSARVQNNCAFSVSLWSVGSNIAGPATLAPGGGYSEQFRKDPVTGGIAIKITRDPNGLYNGSPQLIYAYSLDGDRIWYDLSTAFGAAFAGCRLTERSAEPTCPAIVWENGTPPAGSQVKTCTASADVTLTLCA